MMSGTPDIVDLCSTCIHGPTCTRRIYARAPIWYCNEFDDYVPPPQGRTAKGAAHAAANPKPPSGEPCGTDTGEGLCANCENRDDCLLPRPEGGVWHCEEYR